MTLTEFLLARIDEDEAAAQQEDADFANTSLLPTYDSEHQVRWHTGRVLAECEAKRRIVDAGRAEYEDSLQSGDDTTGLAEEVLHALALPYSDHPDYDEAWRP